MTYGNQSGYFSMLMYRGNARKFRFNCFYKSDSPILFEGIIKFITLSLPSLSRKSIPRFSLIYFPLSFSTKHYIYVNWFSVLSGGFHLFALFLGSLQILTRQSVRSSPTTTFIFLGAELVLFLSFTFFLKRVGNNVWSLCRAHFFHVKLKKTKNWERK